MSIEAVGVSENIEEESNYKKNSKHSSDQVQEPENDLGIRCKY